MKKWSAYEWCIIILVSTIPVTIMAVLIIRLVTDKPLSEAAAAMVSDMLKMIVSGLFGMMGGKALSEKADSNL